MFARRTFLQIAVASSFAPFVGRSTCGGEKRRKKLAMIATGWQYLSPAQMIGDRFLVGYPHKGRWHRPEIDLVSLYVDQKSEGDQSHERANEFGFKIYPTIAETLRCGGSQVGVDAVLIITGDKDHPRDEELRSFFQRVARVFENEGRVVPVYSNQHLSFEKTQRMVDVAKRLEIPMMTGSSLPLTWRLPPIELPSDCIIEQALIVAAGAPRVEGYHALEAMQSMLERRHGGETGVKSVQLIEGEAVWKAGEDNRWSKELLEAALARSDSLQGVSLEQARPQDLVHNGELPRLVKNPAAYLVEYSDGLRSVMLMLNGAVRDFTFAARLKGPARVESTQFVVQPEPNVAHLTCLVAKIEAMIQTGEVPYPMERTLIATGILERCLQSQSQGHRRLKTPELQICYRASVESHFCGS